MVNDSNLNLGVVILIRTIRIKIKKEKKHVKIGIKNRVWLKNLNKKTTLSNKKII